MAVAILQKEEIKSMARIATIQISKAKLSASYGCFIFFLNFKAKFNASYVQLNNNDILKAIAKFAVSHKSNIIDIYEKHTTFAIQNCLFILNQNSSTDPKHFDNKDLAMSSVPKT